MEANLFEDRIVGTVENPHEERVSGPLSLLAVCFDLEGNLVGINPGSVDTTGIEPGETQSFQINIYSLSGLGCPAFLVAGAGTNA